MKTMAMDDSSPKRAFSFVKVVEIVGENRTDEL